jgi:hypothetical protein
MATSARSTFFHLSHCKTLVFRTCDKQLIMAISTCICGKMLVMAKTGVIRKQYFLDGMTFTACRNTKGDFAVVTRPARLTFFHITHGVSFGSSTCNDNTAVALSAGIFGPVLSVAERNSTDILECKYMIRGGRRMAFFTISRYGKRSFTVMTGTARFSLFHLRHCIADTADSTDENAAVTFITFKHIQMYAMTEFSIKGFKINIHDVFMTFLAITFNRKSSITVVTGTA